MRKFRNPKICPILSAKLSSQSNEELPVIIMTKNNNYNNLSNLVFDMNGKIKSELPLINGVACKISTDGIYRLADNPDIEYISFDSKVFALLDIATATIKSNVPNSKGYTGEGITVAIIDTGVSPHNDLTRPKNRIIGFKDFINNKLEPYDDNGHGTHVAGIIGSNGYSSQKKYAGIAPNVNILAVKALDESGSGNTSDIISSISWVIKNKDVYNTKIINLSLGSPANNPYSTDPLCKAVKEAIKSGITVVVAAGNSGPNPQTILSPGISPYVITVGAIDDKRTLDPRDDTVASFSSRGPTKEGLNKPDMVAPGVDILSLSNKKSDGYVPLSGTSMATPMVSGSAALLYEKYNNISPEEVKMKLKTSCMDLNERIEYQGSGMIILEKLFNDMPQKIPSSLPNQAYNKSPKYDDMWENFLVMLLVLFLLNKKY